MRDFLIPSFEQFQRLRELRKAEGKKLAVTTPPPPPPPPSASATSVFTYDAASSDDPDENDNRPQKSTGPLRVIPSTGGSQPGLPVPEVNRQNNNDDHNKNHYHDYYDDSDSATEVGNYPVQTHSAILLAKNEYNHDDSGDDDSTLDDFRFSTKRKESENVLQHVVVKHQRTDDNPTSAVDFLEYNSRVVDTGKKAASKPARGVLTTTSTLLSPLSAGTLSSPRRHEEEPSPELRDLLEKERTRGGGRLKPWFQRNRKPKLQQTRLSF